MTLEDFFTLTEMKDGLTAPARVGELVAVMQKERDCLAKNVGDATRQWSTVGSVISATDSKECLDLFIQLDGLWFINRWLKDAQTFSAAASSFYVEESILALLKVLERLKIDNERLKSSGICITVKDLLSDKSSCIQDRVKVLLESWKTSNLDEPVKVNSVEVQSVHDDRTESGKRLAGESGSSKCSTSDAPHSKATGDHHAYHPLGDDAASSGCCVQQSEGVEPVTKPENLASSNIELDSKDVDSFPVSSVRLDANKVESLVKEEAHPPEEKLGCQNSLEAKQDTDIKKEGSSLECSADALKEKLSNKSLSEKLDKVEVSSAPGIAKSVDVLSTTIKDVPESVGRAAMGTDEDVNSSTVNSMSVDEHPPMGASRIAVDGTGVLHNNCTVTLDCKTSGEGDGDSTNSLQDLPGNATIFRKPVDPKETYSENDNVRSISQVREHAKDESSHSRNSSKYAMPRRDSKRVNVSSKTSAMDLEYGTVDALEVARLVAKEVERQVVEDYDEQFGSSSERSSRSGTWRLVGSPGSLDGENDEDGEGPINELPTVEDMSAEGSPKKDQPWFSSGNFNVEAENGTQDIEFSQVTEAAPEPDMNAEKGTSGIDLNLEVCLEDTDDATNSISNPVSIVSASRAVAAPGLHASPFNFEGSLAWKGAAATSAFCPASPHKSSDGDRSVLVGGVTNSSRQRQDFLIDLNITEDGEDKAVNLVSGKPNPMLSGLPSGESSVEQSPRRFEKLKFDLNQMSEDGHVTPSVWKPFGPKNDDYSPSPASSSSSMKPALRNFDLNDKPSNYNDPLEQKPNVDMFSPHKASASGGSSDDSVISIMGAKVKKNSYLHQTPTPFLNSVRFSEPLVEGNLARGTLSGAGNAVQYTPSIYGYNGIALGPTMPFSSPVYGPGGSVAYMVDPRGVSLVPQLIGSPPSGVQASYANQPSFSTNMMGPLPGPNGASFSRSNLGLSSGFIMEGGNREPGAFRQLFIPGQIRSGEEHLQPLFPGLVSGKRKEPDGGWEPYVTNYKHHQPPYL